MSVRGWALLGVQVTLLCGLLAAPAASAEPVPGSEAVGGAAKAGAPPPRRRGTFVLASFNVLGHKHTAPGGSKASYAGSRTRMNWTIRLLKRHDVGVVGFQELQEPQRRRLLARTDGRWALYARRGDPDNSIGWRARRWSLVEARTFEIPYLGGDPRAMPIVRLRHKRTGHEIVVVNVHNPANTGRYPHQGPHRAEALRREYRVVRTLRRQERVPVYLVGDLNDRRRAFCRLTRGGLLHAAAGGSHGRRCRPPEYGGIDWIFGTRPRTFLDHTVWHTPLVRRTTDHPLVLARVRR